VTAEFDCSLLFQITSLRLCGFASQSFLVICKNTIFASSKPGMTLRANLFWLFEKTLFSLPQNPK